MVMMAFLSIILLLMKRGKEDAMNTCHDDKYYMKCVFIDARGSLVVEALCYKSEGRRFDT
jgi:hypothetical protein